MYEMTQKTIPYLQAALRENATQLRRWYRHGSLSVSGELMANDLEAAAEALGRLEDDHLCLEYLLENAQYYGTGIASPEPAELTIEWQWIQTTPEINYKETLLQQAKEWRALLNGGEG